MPVNALRFVVTIAILSISSACKYEPIKDTVFVPLNQPGEFNAALERVERAIIRAAATYPNWSLKKTGTGHIEAAHFDRGDAIFVELIYNTRTCRIKYKDSENLGYDGKNIHGWYNWVINELAEHIKAELAKPAEATSPQPESN